ncbi:MAG: hypothetical protein CVU46_05555 [Chloroflexi bacterium HGW-Chloroflexi-8]|nr:MAG: hypothetical protein CVU46_05555 [Chloroflexi bacterium HGW-Chloroflexi-8]
MFLLRFFSIFIDRIRDIDSPIHLNYKKMFFGRRNGVSEFNENVAIVTGNPQEMGEPLLCSIPEKEPIWLSPIIMRKTVKKQPANSRCFICKNL